MRVLLTGPVQVSLLARHLGDSEVALPRGLPGTPVAEVAIGLLDRGHDVTIVTMDLDISTERVIEGPRLRLRVGPCRRQRKARDYFRAERAYVTAAVQEEDPEIVHAHWTYEFALGALAAGRPTLVTVHDWAPAMLRLHRDPYRAVKLAAQMDTFRRARYLTAVSPYLATRIQRWARRPVKLIPNALRDEAYLSQPPTRNPGPISLLAVNVGFSRRKNVGALLRAFAMAREARPELTLKLLGPDYGPGDVAQRWAERERLDANVVFAGEVSHEEVLAAYADADIFVHPSLEESFGLVLLEAMATWTPVIAGRASGAVPWVLDDGAAGLLTDVTSPLSIGSAIRALVDDPDRRQQLARSGHARALTFKRSRIMDEYARSYDQVMSDEVLAPC